MTIELFSSASYDSIWTVGSDVWVILNPDENPFTEKIDWHLGLLLRRSLLRIEERSSRTDEPLLLASPEGMPTPCVMVMTTEGGPQSQWLAQLGKHLTRLKIQTATVFAPENWRPPQPKQLADVSQGEWGIRWVDSVN